MRALPGVAGLAWRKVGGPISEQDVEAQTHTFGRVGSGFHSDLPITVFCAAEGYLATVVRDWRPPEPLSVELGPLPSGGSVVFTGGTRFPGSTSPDYQTWVGK